MEILPLVTVIAVIVFLLRKRDQRKRITLLGQHLGHYQIEKLMETVTEGYLRALGEADPERREQIWYHLGAAELRLSEQFSQFSAEFARLDAAGTRVSKLELSIPYATQLFPHATFDLRKALALHADGLARAASNALQSTPKNKAFMLSAELFLMQHTCHWFCNSRSIASARLMVRHQTTHDKVLASVAPQTRAAYRALTGI